MDLRHAELRKAYRWRWLLSINVVWGYRSMKINRGVCFFHMTQRTHTNVNRMQSKCETFKRFAQTLEHLFDKSHIENQCNAKSMQNLFTFLLHVPGLIGNNSFSARYSRTKTNCISLLLLWNNFPFLLMSLRPCRLLYNS